MNRIFFGLVLIAFLTAAYAELRWEPPPPPPPAAEPAPPPADPVLAEVFALRQEVEALRAPPTPPEPVKSPMNLLNQAMFEPAKAAVEIALSLVGAMALFLGLMKVAEAAGLLLVIARLLRPLMVRAFPDVPPDHPAMGAMILNLSANALGLGNAATPLGIRAIQELDKINPHKGTASDPMVLFLAINTAGVTILPTGVIAIRDGLGSADAAGILSTTLFATACSTLSAIVAVKLLRPLFPYEPGPEAAAAAEPERAPEVAVALDEASGAYPLWASVLALLAVGAIVPLALVWGTTVSPWIVPVLMLLLLGFGFARGVPVYEVFVEGAKDGFEVAVRIMPFLVAILVAVGMFRSSGALDAFTSVVGPVTGLVGLPAEALPMALIRPLSGTGATGVMMATMQEHGPDSYVGYLVSTIQGSSETTFYVIAVYCGAIGVRRVRHTLAAGLIADLFGVIGSIVAVQLYFAYNGLW